ncbi:exopolyphosphatase [Desulfuromonas versatilis]|uniref:Exopolyphosphatase n=1 Tax=Desulfuromonas versatilis TaxID=2802975 RepID=A0ABM8I191_9BACT|nr:Ppx/GppA phosphatase family protein [Desulfuromonas versatilis]BCR06807.1 exopolyphosphatase [Desulfuromonas versatilis]
MRPPRLAAIDIGTNSIRCIIVEIVENGDFRILDDEKAMVRLGEGLYASGAISGGAWERAREALLRMRKIMDGLGVETIEAVATSAVRKAANGAEFLVAMERETGIGVRLIDGEEEAELAALSAWHHFDMANARYLLVDIGGGSVEVVSAVGRHIEEITSLELGAVFLTEHFLAADPIPDKELSHLRKHIRQQLRAALDPADFPVRYLIGSGGTMTTIAGMVKAGRKERYDSVHGYEVLHSEIVHLLAMLARKTCKERRSLPGLSPERADIIVAGVAVVDELMRLSGTNLLKVNERGIREGLILKSLQKHGYLERRRTVRDWRTSVQDFARSCHVDEGHGEQVAKLALQLFDALAQPFSLAERERQLLEAAALLHDVGYFISYSAHHKHSYHLIRYASLFDFSPREKELIANLARYHRKALPKKKHEGFAGLGREDQALVKRLGGILRLADGLDRRRSGAVSALQCELADGALRVRLEGAEDLSVELYGGQVKGDLFEQAFGCRLELTAT